MSESFAELFEESLKTLNLQAGSIITGVIVDIDYQARWVTVHAVLKSEALIPLEQFYNDAGELNIQMSGEFLQQLFIGQVDTMIVRSKRQQAIKRTGIQQIPAQTLGQNSGYGALARAAWPINGDDRCNVFHD